MDKLAALRQYYGHSRFREGQELIVDRLLAGKDVLAVMPTGGGKSICYQLPALLTEGVALVVSPLISLMRDQVLALKQAGIPAAYINSSLTPAQLSTVYRRLRGGAYKIVYVAPERLEAEGFVAAASTLKLSLVAVDEAHCISQWGQDFRPSYRRIPAFLAQLPHRPPVGAFTATATQAVRQDIAQQLGLQSPFTLVTGFDRPNLYFGVQSLKASEKPAVLRELLRQRSARSGIVYCATRSGVERVCADLTLHGFPATRYHAGLSDQERTANQADFQYDRRTIMVATNAFGMGIDKSNVSFVIHYQMPKSLEAYYQEAGRAGRDGSRADCLLLFSPGDINTAQYLIQTSADNADLSEGDRQQLLRQEHQRLHAMVSYCKTTTCLRSALLDYFGQRHGDRCDNCSACLTRFRLRDITREAQMILSCARRAEDRLGHPCPEGLLADILYGSTKPEVTAPGLDGLSTYGLLRHETMPQLMVYLEQLTQQGLLARQDDGLTLTEAARGVLFRGEPVRIPIAALPGETAPRHSGEELAGEDAELYTALQAVRRKLADRESVPAYVVLSNATLAELARCRPRSQPELLEISGIGTVKARRYGKALLQAISDFEQR